MSPRPTMVPVRFVAGGVPDPPDDTPEDPNPGPGPPMPPDEDPPLPIEPDLPPGRVHR